MTEHIVQQQLTSQGIILTCMDCSWHATLGYKIGVISYEQLQQISPVATVIKWAHTDPSLLAPLHETPPERSFLERVRSYLMNGVAP